VAVAGPAGPPDARGVDFRRTCDVVRVVRTTPRVAVPLERSRDQIRRRGRVSGRRGWRSAHRAAAAHTRHGFNGYRPTPSMLPRAGGELPAYRGMIYARMGEIDRADVDQDGRLCRIAISAHGAAGSKIVAATPPLGIGARRVQDLPTGPHHGSSLIFEVSRHGRGVTVLAARRGSPEPFRSDGGGL